MRHEKADCLVVRSFPLHGASHGGEAAERKARQLRIAVSRQFAPAGRGDLRSLWWWRGAHPAQPPLRATASRSGDIRCRGIGLKVPRRTCQQTASASRGGWCRPLATASRLGFASGHTPTGSALRASATLAYRFGAFHAASRPAEPGQARQEIRRAFRWMKTGVAGSAAPVSF